MRNDLSGRVAIITGGSRGVGRDIARRLAAEGATVAVNYRRDGEAARSVVDEIRAAGGTANAYQGSVGDPADVAAMVEAVRRDLGRISILVSNAGSASRGLTVAETPATEFAALMNVHAFGPINLIQKVIEDLRAADRGDIVLISSTTTAAAPAGAAPYTMAKSAIETCFRTIAREERQHGVRANIVAPGLVATEMGRRAVRAATNGGSIEDLSTTAPFGRVCSPTDVAAAVAFFLSQDSDYITGQKIDVDGGGSDVALF